MELQRSRIALVWGCLIVISTTSSSLAADGTQAYITTAQPTVLFSINDGEAGSLVSGVRQVVDDSVTVIRVFPDQPPTIATVYDAADKPIGYRQVQRLALVVDLIAGAYIPGVSKHKDLYLILGKSDHKP